MLVLAIALPGAAVAADADAPRAGELPYAGHSDQQLTELAAQWDALDVHERRALLTEMKTRMARNKSPRGVLRITTERRYGRLVNQNDGRVIHIQTQVVRVRPVPESEAAQAAARQSFGTGFERRLQVRAAPRTLVEIPVPLSEGALPTRTAATDAP
ncbi:MAG: hypothetical protein R3E86_17345 [Pseudomonadales bacterium]